MLDNVDVEDGSTSTPTSIELLDPSRNTARAASASSVREFEVAFLRAIEREQLERKDVAAEGPAIGDITVGVRQDETVVLHHVNATVALGLTIDGGPCAVSEAAHLARIITQRLGHAKEAITIDTYSHVLPATDAATAHLLATLILGGP